MNAAGCLVRRRPAPVATMPTLVLADGRRVLLRPLTPEDAPATQAFVMALSPAARYRRFHVGLRALPEPALQQLTRIDQDRHVAWVAQPPAWAGAGPAPPPLVADVRYVRADDPEEAEFAVAVADAWQRQGLARSLLCLLARHAARRGIRRLAGDVLVENTPMLALLRSLGGELRWRAGEPGLVRAALAL